MEPDVPDFTANANAGPQLNSRPDQWLAAFRARGDPELGVSGPASSLFFFLLMRVLIKAESIFGRYLGVVAGLWTILEPPRAH